MTTKVYPVGPNPKSDKRIKTIVAILGMFAIFGMSADMVMGSSVTNEGHVIKNVNKQKSVVQIDRGPNQGETVRASYATTFTVQSNKPEIGEDVQVVSNVGASGVRYTSKLIRKKQ